MDPFTQRMLERAKSRREKLDSQKLELQQRLPLQEKFSPNVNDAVNTHMNPEKATLGNNNNNKGKQCITSLRRSKLQKLARLYSDEEKDDFLNDVNFDNDHDEDLDKQATLSNNLERKHPCKFARLNELATKIKEWEDDIDCGKHNSKSADINYGVDPKDSSMKAQEESPKRIDEKEKFWDAAMVEKLCSQGFSRSESQSKLMYDFRNKRESEEKEIKGRKVANGCDGSRDERPSTKHENKILTGPKQNEVLKKAALFESATKEEQQNKVIRDPAELPLAERKALFEKNSSTGILPKHGFAVSGKKCSQKEKLPLNNLPKFVSSEKKENNSNETVEMNTNKYKRMNDNEGKLERPNKGIEAMLIHKKEPIIDKEIIADISDKPAYLGKEVRSKTPPPPPPLPNYDKSPSVNSKCLGEVQDIEVKFPKSGRLYPSLSNLHVTEENEIPHSETDFNDSNFCLNMTLSDLLEMSKNNPTTPPGDQSFSKTKESQVLRKMDKLLEDALNDLSSSEDDDEFGNIVPSPPKMKKSSSFEYKSCQESENVLLHTVSFYRRRQQQQQQQHITCEQSENASEKGSSSPSQEDEDESIIVKKKIESLIAEVNKQQTIISQASQALNLCLSTIEFSGSGEQVEGERLLLLASHKRQACLNEIQRLKIENSLRPQGENSLLTEKGDVHLSNISVKLKRDALRAMAAAENLHYFVCLIKSDEQVLATAAVSATRDNLKDMVLQFPGQVKLEGLFGNFKITIEVYNLELGKELLPHNVKYHIVTKKEKKLLTPIKSKKSESKLVKPNIQSPAGPNAVRSSNFQMCGYIVFSIREITRTQWILNKVPYVSLLEGTLSMTIQSQLSLNEEFRGFLTMFDDISGFGAWHRRWCLLSSHFISFWKYPDDEQKKVPIGTIDLRSVITENVGLVSRDICARLNTFLLETTRPRLNDDKDSLVVNIKGNVTTIRHLLSADSKQEMVTWCKKLNKTLALLRSWKCNFIE